MNIWLLNPYGPIPGEGWRDYRFTMLGTELAKRGHSVTWWTANFSHHFKRFRSETWRDVAVAHGFQIRLVPTTSYSKNISLGRVRFEATYAWRVYRRAVEDSCPNFIVATDPSQIVGYLGVRLANRFNVPLLLDVFDLWPELFALAFPRFLRSLAPIVFLPLYFLRRHNLRRADALTALCDTYLDVAKCQAPKFLSTPSLTAFNGIDVAAFRANLPDENEMVALVEKWGKNPGDIWAIYAGSLGDNYDIKTLLQAATQLERNSSRVKVWIAGEGPLRPLVANFIRTEGSKKIVYLGKLNPMELIKLYGICDIGLCTYGPESNVAMPDKAYDYMAAGLPIVNSLRGELENFLREQQIGIQYVAGDSNSLANALESLGVSAEQRQLMATNSYNAAMKFDQHVQYQKYVDFIEGITISNN
jgi:glycosyltransferase involved in cell wall biosynthesis